MPDDSTNQGVPQGSGSQENGPAPPSPPRNPDPIDFNQGDNPCPVGDFSTTNTSAAPNNTGTTDPLPEGTARSGTPDAGTGPAGNPEPIAQWSPSSAHISSHVASCRTRKAANNHPQVTEKYTKKILQSRSLRRLRHPPSTILCSLLAPNN